MKKTVLFLTVLFLTSCQNQVNTPPGNTTSVISPHNSWSGVSYMTYYNERFGYKIDYPSVLKVTNAPENDDGRTFSYGGLTITVFGSYNALFTTVQEQFKENQKPTDTYKVVKSNWFVRSGIDSKGFVYYEKSILKNDTWYTVVLELLLLR